MTYLQRITHEDYYDDPSPRDLVARGSRRSRRTGSRKITRTRVKTAGRVAMVTGLLTTGGFLGYNYHDNIEAAIRPLDEWKNDKICVNSVAVFKNQEDVFRYCISADPKNIYLESKDKPPEGEDKRRVGVIATLWVNKSKLGDNAYQAPNTPKALMDSLVEKKLADGCKQDMDALTKLVRDNVQRLENDAVSAKDLKDREIMFGSRVEVEATDATQPTQQDVPLSC